MNKKKCTNCGDIKFLHEFYVRRASYDGLMCECKKCKTDRIMCYKKSKSGLITQIYANQKSNSKRRKHSSPTYTKKELKEWLFSQQLFHELFDSWKKSGYKKDLAPSVDRKDDYEGYSLNNIQLMTWKENNSKHYNDRICGINNKQSKAIIQYDLGSKMIKEYYSIMQAGRETGITYQNIFSVLKGSTKTAGGFVWKYK